MGGFEWMEETLLGRRRRRRIGIGIGMHRRRTKNRKSQFPKTRTRWWWRRPSRRRRRRRRRRTTTTTTTTMARNQEKANVRFDDSLCVNVLFSLRLVFFSFRLSPIVSIRIYTFAIVPLFKADHKRRVSKRRRE